MADPITLQASRKKWVRVFLGCAAFVTIGFLVIDRMNAWIAWLCIGFFSLSAIVAGVQLIPGASYLRIDDDGMEYKAFHRKRRFEWESVKSMGLWKNGGNTFVTVETGGQGKMAEINRKLCGADDMLPDTYGMKPEELLGLLAQHAEAWHERHAGQHEFSVATGKTNLTDL